MYWKGKAADFSFDDGFGNELNWESRKKTLFWGLFLHMCLLFSGDNCFQRALSTLPERRQRVQTTMRLGLPSTMALTFFKLGAQVRFVLTLE
jgi:hypothetical protein